jgi:hypothetical protein
MPASPPAAAETCSARALRARLPRQGGLAAAVNAAAAPLLPLPRRAGLALLETLAGVRPPIWRWAAPVALLAGAAKLQVAEDIVGMDCLGLSAAAAACAGEHRSGGQTLKMLGLAEGDGG